MWPKAEWTAVVYRTRRRPQDEPQTPRQPAQKNRTADEWESYLTEHRATVERQSREFADTESELNERVYRLFNLAYDEIRLLQREVEHGSNPSIAHVIDWREVASWAVYLFGRDWD